MSLIHRAARPIRDVLRRREQRRDQERSWTAEWDVERELEDVIAAGRTLIVGPWLSEVGYEALYWIPFLRWVKDAFRLDPARVVAVSRGGVSSWYDGIAGRYIEIWDEIDPAQFARRVAERGSAKQLEVTAFDLDVVKAVRQRLGGAAVDVLHPSLMYRLFSFFWSGRRGMGFLDSHTRFRRVEAPQVIDPARLPARYVAVKFYAARSLPDTQEIRRTLTRFVAGLAEHTDVVMLDTGLVLDEHADYPFEASENIVSAQSWMSPRDNLAVQTQIIAGARAFVGTCGSVAWLAPMLGVNTSAIFLDPKWLHVHLGVALRAAHRVDGGYFAACDLRALQPLGGSTEQDPLFALRPGLVL